MLYDNKLSNLLDYVESVLCKIDFKNNIYFSALGYEKFKKEDFIETQIQFYFVVKFFPKFLSEVIPKLPESALKLSIIENFYYDHNSNVPENKFLYFLNNLGVSEEDVEKRVLWPETRMFIMSLLGTCALDMVLVSCATLGVIEYMFLQVSKIIEGAVVKLGWLDVNKTGFYINHEKLDQRHAQELFNIVLKSWNDPENQYYVKQGLELGAYSFNLLFNELYKNRERRYLRTLKQDHIKLGTL